MTSQSPDTDRWRSFALLALAFFMTVIDLTIVNVSLPTIGRDLHFSQTNLQWVVTAYALTFGGFLLLSGRAADLLGRRRILMFGLGLFSAASLAAALATGAGFMIGARAVQGIGAAIMLPAALSIVMNMFEEGAERNKALGIWGGLGAGGATVGVIAGGLLTRYAGWQYIFYLNVPIGRYRDRYRLERRCQPHPNAASRRPRRARGAHRRFPAGALGARRDRPARRSGDLRARPRRSGPAPRGQDERPRSPTGARLHQLTNHTTQGATTMRKIINSAFVSPEGVTEDPRSWATFDSGSAEEAVRALNALDGFLMGRGTYEYFADVVPDQTGPYADAINAIRKYVFSSTLERADWNNSTIIREDVVGAVTELKQQDGGDLMMYGYGRLNQTLLENHLVDEIRFSVHPVLAAGRAAGGGPTIPLNLLAVTPSPNGVVALTYVPTSG
jgi:dihydrofolate reductase